MSYITYNPCDSTTSRKEVNSGRVPNDSFGSEAPPGTTWTMLYPASANEATLAELLRKLTPEM